MAKTIKQEVGSFLGDLAQAPSDTLSRNRADAMRKAEEVMGPEWAIRRQRVEAIHELDVERARSDYHFTRKIEQLKTMLKEGRAEGRDKGFVTHEGVGMTPPEFLSTAERIAKRAQEALESVGAEAAWMVMKNNVTAKDVVGYFRDVVMAEDLPQEISSIFQIKGDTVTLVGDTGNPLVREIIWGVTKRADRRIVMEDDAVAAATLGPGSALYDMVRMRP